MSKLIRALASAFAFLFVAAFALPAMAAGSVTFSKREFHESNGGWNLVMTVNYGGTPQTAHVPMRFTFTPTAIYERYLDDTHGDKPQTRKIALVGQVPLNESVDVDFSDSRGKLFSKTKFDFTITRAHNFVAGDYSVTVHRADGAAMGGAQTVVLLGDNTVIDRRAISFVASPKKDKHAAASADAGAAAAEKPEPAPAAADEPSADTAAPAASATTAQDDPNAVDPTAAAKVPPGSHGCGCRVGPAQNGTWPLLGLLMLASTGLWRLRRRPGSL
jgi:MYXO-CTERM domain-containing protein